MLYIAIYYIIKLHHDFENLLMKQHAMGEEDTHVLINRLLQYLNYLFFSDKGWRHITNVM